MIKTRHENETYMFFKDLSKDSTFKETASKLDVSYDNLFQSFQKNRISYRLKVRIEKQFILTNEQKQELNNLVAR